MLFVIKENENATQNIRMIYFGIKTGAVELKTVEVVGEKKQFVNADADKTTYQVMRHLLTGSMRDAVRKLPGVVIGLFG